MHCATSEADSGSSFQFSPTTWPIAPPKPRDVPNRSSNGDRLDILDVSDNLEVHPFPYATKSIPGLTLRLRSGRASSRERVRRSWLSRSQHVCVDQRTTCAGKSMNCLAVVKSNTRGKTLLH